MTHPKKLVSSEHLLLELLSPFLLSFIFADLFTKAHVAIHHQYPPAKDTPLLEESNRSSKSTRCIQCPTEIMQRARNTSEERCRVFSGYHSSWSRVDNSHGALKIAQRRDIALDISRMESRACKNEEHIDKGCQYALHFGTLPCASFVLREDS